MLSAFRRLVPVPTAYVTRISRFLYIPDYHCACIGLILRYKASHLSPDDLSHFCDCQNRYKLDIEQTKVCNGL